jgi:DNA primase
MRLGYNEQTLTAKLNEEIRNFRDEQRKSEQRRINSPEASTETIAQTPDTAPETSTETETPPAVPPADINLSSLSTLIIKEVIKHGGMTLYNNVATDDGRNISLTLAQFVDFDLKNDGLQFAEPLYNKILAEAVEHSTEEDFDSERYFTLHPDYDISSLAIRLCADNVILSKSLQVEVTPYTMQEQINHMLLDFRNEYIMQHIKLLTKEISEASNEPDRQIELMAELKEAQQLRSMIARKIGNSVVARRL